MKAYRIAVDIEDGNDPIHHFVSPQVFLFPPFKCAYQYEQDFLDDCLSKVPGTSKQDAKMYYKEYEIHPLKDLIKRIYCAIKYFI